MQAVSRLLRPGEKLFAFLNDIYVLCPPARVVEVYGILQAELWRHAGIQINGGKTQVWNQAGVYPPRCEVLEQIARQEDPEATVWTGSGVPTEQQGVRILGAPLGHTDFVFAFLERKSRDHHVLLSRIPRVEDVQSAWALLLHCASARANYLLRVVRPELVREFAERHDQFVDMHVRDFEGGPSQVSAVPTPAIQRRCLLRWEVLVSEVRFAQVVPRVGRVGLMCWP